LLAEALTIYLKGHIIILSTSKIRREVGEEMHVVNLGDREEVVLFLEVVSSRAVA